MVFKSLLRYKGRTILTILAISIGVAAIIGLGALANNPPLVLADEPTGSLDTEGGRALMGLLRELNRSQGTTFIVVTHDPAVARQTNRVLVMEDGKVVREDLIGSPIEEDLKMWRHSGLGRRIMDGDHDGALADLGLDRRSINSVRSLLYAANRM